MRPEPNGMNLTLLIMTLNEIAGMQTIMPRAENSNWVKFRVTNRCGLVAPGNSKL
jgi:hypothetical protein